MRGQKHQKSVMVINDAGDFLEALRGFEAGIPEYYFAQHFSVKQALELTRQFSQVSIVDLRSNTAHDTEIAENVRVLGLKLNHPIPSLQVIKKVRHLKPTHVFLRTTNLGLVFWLALTRRAACIVSASSITPKTGLVAQLRQRALAFLMNRRNFIWVAAYGTMGAKSFADIGVDPSKIIPWDYLHLLKVDEFEALKPKSDANTRLVYVGQISVRKGVADAMDAVASLNKAGRLTELSIIGTSPEPSIKERVATLGLEDKVHFVGKVPTAELETYIRRFDAIVVPSRHEYPEGFPLVIVHALRARLPIIASDHPMFRQALIHREGALIFRASDPKDLHDKILMLKDNPDLAWQLSLGSPDVLTRLRLPVHYGHILKGAFETSGEDAHILAANTLAKHKT